MDYIKSFDEFQIFEANNNANMQKLENAVNNKFVCVIDYRGEIKGKVDDGIRYIEPYVIGTNAIGNVLVRAWMIKGTSRTGKIDPSLVPGWRLYRLDRIFNVTSSNEQFKEPKKGYNSEDKKMTDIIVSANF